MDTNTQTTSLLQDVEHGGQGAADRLLEAVYPELRALANHALQQEVPGHTLQPTALVHEAYLKLIDQSRVTWKSRAHFFAIAAQSIRRILIDHARKRKADKRGGGWQRLTLDPSAAANDTLDVDLLALETALEKLAELHPRQAKVVELKFFGGLGNEEVAEALDISRTTVAADWTVARAWLSRELAEAER